MKMKSMQNNKRTNSFTSLWILSHGFFISDNLMQALGPFTHASKNRGFSKIAILGWKLLSNFHPNNPKTSPEKSLSGVGFFETPRETSRSFASVNANRRKIAIFST